MIKDEEWRDIKQYEGLYQVSSHGRIRSFKYNRIKILSPNVNNNGYYTYKFTVDYISKTIPIHRLVAQAFIPNPKNLPCVNHIDGNKVNNKVENLEWCTYSENTLHAYRTGLELKHDSWQKQPFQKGVLEVNSNKFYFSIRECSRQLGINRNNIRRSLKYGISVIDHQYKFIYTTKEKPKMDYKKQVQDLLHDELVRQENTITLIASENYASQDVLDACGHCIQNRYTEGYVPDPKTGAYRRYYGGCEVVDKIEQLTADLVCKAFKTKFSNVQSHSGSSANLTVYAAATKYFKCKPDELNIISHSLNSGSHLTHGSKASASGKWFNAIQFETDDNGYFNYNEMKRLLVETNGPTVLVVGFSAYPREVEFDKIAAIVKDVNKDIIVLCDTSHISGMVVAGLHKNPFDYDWGIAHVILTSTTHKTLRGPRHALITTNDEQLADLIDKSCFPFLAGGSLQNMTGALGIAMSEALQPEFKTYAQNLLNNIQAMCKVFKERDVDMVTGGSDNHLILLDFKKENFSGADLEKALEACGIIANKNAVKNDTRPKMETSGLRIGTAAITTRGANEEDCTWVAGIICDVIDDLRNNKPVDAEVINKEISEWCKKHPIYA